MIIEFNANEIIEILEEHMEREYDIPIKKSELVLNENKDISFRTEAIE